MWESVQLKTTAAKQCSIFIHHLSSVSVANVSHFPVSSFSRNASNVFTNLAIKSDTEIAIKHSYRVLTHALLLLTLTLTLTFDLSTPKSYYL